MRHARKTITTLSMDEYRRITGQSSSIVGPLAMEDDVEWELEIGVLLSERRNPVHGVPLRRWLNEPVLPAFAVRILPVDQPVTLKSASLHVPDL